MSRLTATLSTRSRNEDLLGADVVVPALPRQRSNRVMFLGIAMAGLGCLLGWSVYTGVNDQTPVVVVARDVPVGTVLSASDLSTALVSAESQVSTIPGSQLKQLLGTVAATDLRKGTLLVPSEVTTALKPAAGQVLISLPMRSSQLPARGLKSGDLVQIVATPGQGGQGSTATAEKPLITQPVTATVDHVGTLSSQGTVVVDVIVESSAGVAVSQQASTGRIALILQPRTP